MDKNFSNISLYELSSDEHKNLSDDKNLSGDEKNLINMLYSIKQHIEMYSEFFNINNLYIKELVIRDINEFMLIKNHRLKLADGKLKQTKSFYRKITKK